MKKVIPLFFLLVLSISLYAQSENEKAVAQSVEHLKSAMINSDKEQLYKLTSKDLSYGHSSGNIENQEAYITSLVSGKSDFKNMNLTDQTIKVIDNIALVRHKLAADVVDSGKPGNVNLGVLLVWINQEGEWKLLARQAYKL